MSLPSRSLCLCILAVITLQAQQVVVPSVGSSPRKLAFLLPGFLEDTLQGVDAAFRPILQQSVNPNLNLSSLNSAVATELSNLPVPSPASAVRYAFDPNLGIYVTSAQSLGPILT